jgi:hypothetical protein
VVVGVVSVLAVLVAVAITTAVLLHRGDGSAASGPKPVTRPTVVTPSLDTATPSTPNSPTSPAPTSPTSSAGWRSQAPGGAGAAHNVGALRAAQMFLGAAKAGRCTDAFGFADGIFKKSFRAETTCGTSVRRALAGWSVSTSGAFDRFGAFGTYTFADGTTVNLHHVGERWKVSSFLPPY